MDNYTTTWLLQRWGLGAKVLKKTGAKVRSLAMIYKAMVQTVLLYGSKILIVTDAVLKVQE